MSTSQGRRLPIVLQLKGGLALKGNLHVEARVGNGYIGHFDTSEADSKLTAGVVFDRIVWTREQILRWTGVDLDRDRISQWAEGDLW